jgi:hypothetical protein
MNRLIHVVVAIISEASICSMHLRKQVYSCVLMTNYITCSNISMFHNLGISLACWELM